MNCPKPCIHKDHELHQNNRISRLLAELGAVVHEFNIWKDRAVEIEIRFHDIERKINSLGDSPKNL